MNNDISERARQLAKRAYTEVVIEESLTSGSPVYVALTPELDGCLAQGNTAAEALEFLSLFRIEYIQHLLEHHLPVPDPA